MSLTSVECQVSELINSDAWHAPRQVLVDTLTVTVCRTLCESLAACGGHAGGFDDPGICGHRDESEAALALLGANEVEIEVVVEQSSADGDRLRPVRRWSEPL
jgi:hypothetical protein